MMDWKMIEEMLEPDRPRRYPRGEVLVSPSITRCKLCNNKRKSTHNLSLECCREVICADCHIAYFFMPGEYNKLSKMGNEIGATLASLAIVPAMIQKYKKVKRICRFECPFCKAKVTYHFESKKKEIKKSDGTSIVSFIHL